GGDRYASFRSANLERAALLRERNRGERGREHRGAPALAQRGERRGDEQGDDDRRARRLDRRRQHGSTLRCDENQRSEQEIDRVGPRERIQRGERFCPAERAEHVCDRERARRETDEDRGGAERPSLPRRLTEGGYRDFPLLVGERGPQR